MADEPLTQWMVGIIRARMAEHGLSYADLEERLRAIGVDDNERNLRNKVMRGTFSAAFWIQCLVALGVRSIELHPDRLGLSDQPAFGGAYANTGEALTEIFKVIGSGDEEPSTTS
ncbi:DUF6471 domain-containing protein [Brevundimonas sp. SL161]|uniref:DUF6471 domain-containing protein n=1 Tax=Brevundimonas sp. SL161 TaxID=2804613 RepID=UPI003CFBB3A8